MKKLVHKISSPQAHWVGDGFPVRNMLSPGKQIVGPFIFLDAAGPAHFEPTDQPRGVDSHPHKGFETVTVVYQGEVEHRDSAGNSGKIGPGEVQWMTAGRGVLHEEKHGREFAARGGVLEMIQLWVNLPARDKGVAPKYQSLTSAELPRVAVNGGSALVIAGDLGDTNGPASTFTPLLLWSFQMDSSGEITLPILEGFEAGVYVRVGSASIGGQRVEAGELGVFSEADANVIVVADAGAEFLVLGGEPIREPIAAYGPFVMNTQEEILQAISEFRGGKYGVLESRA